VRTRLPVRLKIAVVTAGLTFGILCLFAVVIGAVAEERVHDAFDDDLRATVADLANRLDPEVAGPDQIDVDDAQLVGAASGDAEVRVIQGNGLVYFPPGGLPLSDPGSQGLSDAGDYRVASRALTISNRRQSNQLNAPLTDEPLTATVGFVQYAKPKDTTATTINRIRLFLAFGVLGGTLLAFIAGLHVAQRAMRPIAGLTRAAREVARTRDPGVKLSKPRANDEVADLAHTFEDMLQELSAARGETEATLARQREFVADASHELRTPLTSVLANLELLEEELAGEQREAAASALRSSRRMRRLVADLLLLARADAGRVAPHMPVDLSEIVTDAAAELEPVAGDHEISIWAPSGAHVDGARDELHRLVLNLMENALRHTDPGTAVEATVERRNGEVVLAVEDDGPGIPIDLREKVFERFYRGTGDRSGSSGLGLSIVRAVAESHHGSVRLEEPLDGRGARFVVRIPTA
jgi:two-component system, OmpR family, sensor kinase